MFILTVASVLLGAGQPHFLIKRTWDSASGLPHSSVVAFEESPDGYLWVGTQRGLARFDGLNFQLDLPNKEKPMPCVSLEDLEMDSEGTLWIATQTCGLYRMTSPFHFEKHPIPEIYFSKLSWDNTNKHLWAVANDGRLYAIQGDTWKRYTISDFLDQGQAEIVKLQPDRRDGSLWLASLSGLYHLTSEKVIDKVEIPGERRLYTVFQDDDNTIWVGGKSAYKLVDGRPVKVPSIDAEPHHHISAFAQGEIGLLASVSQGGLYRLEGDHLAPFYPVEDGVAAELRVNMAFDREGNIWHSSMTSGLTRRRKGRVHFIRDGCPRTVCHAWSIMRRSNGEMWIGRDDRIDIYTDTGKMTTPPVLARKMTRLKRPVVTMEETIDGDVLIGTREAGAWRWDGQKITPIELQSTATIIRGIVASRDGTVWIAPASGGLQRDTGNGFRMVAGEMGLEQDDIFSMIEDREGRLWVGTLTGGIYRIGHDGTQQFGIKHGLPNLVISTFHQDHRGRMWIGTMFGLAVYDGDQIYKMEPNQGLSDETVMAVKQDGAGTLWISMSGSLMYGNPDHLAAFMRGDRQSSGLATMERYESPHTYSGNVAGNRPAAMDPKGRVWFSTERGAAIVDSRMKTDNPIEVHPTIDAILIDDQPVDTIPAVLSRDVNRLELYFNGPCLTEGAKTRFRYQLEGLDPGWRDADEKRFASYTSLPAGDYTFRVIAANNTGVWGEEGIQLSFKVPKPLWLSWWALLGYVLLLGLAVYSLLTLQAARAARRARLLEELVTSRTRGLIKAQEELMESAHRAGIAAHATEVLHSVGNTVNSINTSTALLRENLEDPLWPNRLRRMISLLDQDNHPLTQSLAQHEQGATFIEGLRRIRDGIHQDYQAMVDELTRVNAGLAKVRGELLAEQQHELSLDTMATIDVSLLTREALDAEEAFLTSKNMTVSCLLSDALWVRLERVRFKHVLLCLLSNACEARRQGQGSLTVIAHRHEESIILSFRDDGVGIEPAILEKVVLHGFSTKPGAAGMGLHFCANALSQFNGSLELRSEGKDRGTEVRLIFPAQQPPSS